MDYTEIKDVLTSIAMECDHGIPFYAYGNNQAACQMSDLLQNISNQLDNLNSEIFEEPPQQTKE